MQRLKLRLAADPAALATLRPSVREWLERLDVVEPELGAIVGACWEVAADAAESASANGHAIELTGILAGGDVVVRCAGPVGWRFEDHPSRFVAALLVDDVSIEESAGGVSVVLRKAASRGLRL